MGLGIKYVVETPVGEQYPRLGSGRGYYKMNQPARVQSNKELLEYSQNLQAEKADEKQREREARVRDCGRNLEGLG